MPSSSSRALLLLRPERRRAPPRRTATASAAVWSPAPGHLGPREHESLARARHRDVQQAPHLGDVRCRVVVPGSSSLSSTSGTELGRHGARRACGSAARPARTRSRTPAPWLRASSSPAPLLGCPGATASSSRSPAAATAVDVLGEVARAAATPACGAAQAAARSANLAMFTSRSSDSERALKRCCLRSPMRSIRRCTNRSGRMSSNAFAAERCSRRKVSIRSRASGGTSGDSSAAPSAVTMSVLRRRAIVRAYARGPPGRARPGGASARARRRGRRWGRPAGAARPAGRAPPRARRSRRRRRAGRGCRAPRARSPPAGPRCARSARAPPWCRASTPSAITRSSSAATACACARSFSQRQKDTGSRPADRARDAPARSFLAAGPRSARRRRGPASRIAWCER